MQGNIKLCLANLLKALKYALANDDLEEYDVSAHVQGKLPIIETYINICNAYSSQFQTQDALKYIEGAISMS